MEYPFKRPPNAPDVWRREDFILEYTGSLIEVSEKYTKTQYVHLCKVLDQLIGHERGDFPPIDREYHRIRILTLFRDDHLRAAEIIDAYNLSE